MTVFKTLVAIHDEYGRENSRIVIADTIEHEGDKWLVPSWTGPPSGEWRMPERIVRVVGLEFLPAPAGYGADFLLSHSLPKDALEAGLAPLSEEHEIVVIEAPDIRFPPPDNVH